MPRNQQGAQSGRQGTSAEVRIRRREAVKVIREYLKSPEGAVKRAQLQAALRRIETVLDEEHDLARERATKETIAAFGRVVYELADMFGLQKMSADQRAFADRGESND